MVEYILDVIKATAGEDIAITAKITETTAAKGSNNYSLLLFNGDSVVTKVKGLLLDNMYLFTIPANITAELSGKYWYQIVEGDTSIMFKKPIYLV